jgi:hypothetical protein
MISTVKINLRKQTDINKEKITYRTTFETNFTVMKITTLLILFLSFLFHQNLKAQQDNILFLGTPVSHEYALDNNTNQDLDITKQSLISFERNDNSILIDNIQINQIGNYNKSKVYQKTVHLDLTLNQYGVNNEISFHKSNSEIKQMIQQVGDSNFVSDFSINSNYKVDMQISQEGNNLTLFNNGTNSISKEMKVIQTGNFGTIFIYNR